MKTWIRTFLLCLLLCCLAVCAQAEEPELLDPVGVQLNAVAAWQGEISKITPYEGAVVPYVEEFFFEQEGVIDEMHVVVGQLVKAGDPMITLNTEAEEERLEALQEQIAQLKTNADYEDQLWQLDLDMLDVELRRAMNAKPRDDAAVALKQLEIEEKRLDIELEKTLRDLKLNQLEAEKQSLEEEIAENVMYAPFDGRVMYMSGLMQHGTYVGAYAPLIYLADDSRLRVECEYISSSWLVGAHDVYALVGGRKWDVTAMPYDEKEYMSKLLSGETLTLQFSFDEPDDTLAAGQYAVICLERDYKADALLVPTNALYADDTLYLYVMENGVRVRRDVKTGNRTDWYTEITEGLEEGELVYVQE